MTQPISLKLSIFTSDAHFPDVSLFDKRITHLDITGCKFITDISVPFFKALSNLQQIDISGAGISLCGALSLVENENLKVLFMDKIIIARVNHAKEKSK